ncbi:MAG TPA: WbqC family protein [Prolixibacteraceae bacterium]
MESSGNKVILNTAYLAPVQYFTKLLHYHEVWMDTGEHFLKQSYRNRCTILTANGPQNLSVPVAEGANSKKVIRDVMISYDHPWQKLHWKALISAYNNAPFFEYYSDSLAPFYEFKKWKFLADFNLEIQDVILSELNIKCNVNLKEQFIPEKDIPLEMDDFRYVIHPKVQRQKEDIHFRPQVYMQVFQEKFGFSPNLSIVDLLFNEGPNARDMLIRSYL